jgi:lipopolysaccharide export system permease protein
MRILDRYVLREIAVHFVAVTGVLFVILVSFQVGKVLSQAAANQFPRDVVWSLIGLTSIKYLTILIPLGLFLAVMLALGRLYHDSEMAAVRSCGVGLRRLLRPIMMLTAFVVLLLLWLAFAIGPEAAARAEQLRIQAIREARLAGVEPQHFGSFANGSVVYYAESIDSAGVLYNVFVQRRVGDRVEVTIAKRAEQLGVGEEQQTFVLYEGERYEGVPGSGESRTSKFGEFGYPIQLPTAANRAARIEAKPTMELLSFDAAADRAELENRVAAPLMALLLALLATPLARLRPRQGRYAKMGIALLAYFIYLVLLNTARAWIEKQTGLGMLGLWWVHALAAAFAVWLMWRQDPPSFVLRRVRMQVV